MLFLRIILFPLTPVYRWVIWLRNFLFDLNIFKQHAVKAKVVSIGNITVGGSGKTPAVIYITALLKHLGLKTGVLSRGYGRTSKGYKLVSDGHEIKAGVNECGDEIYLTSVMCQVPAAVCEKRAEGADKFLRDVDLDVIVLDDAFQHRWLKRDLDILIFDQNFLIKQGGMDQNLLPIGIMREPFDNIKRADAVIINRKFSEISYLPVALRKYFEGRQIFTAYYRATGLVDVKNFQFFDMSEFDGQKSLIVSGIARPHSFLSVLQQYNIDVTNQMIFRDHKQYSGKEIQLIRKEFYATNAQSVLTTQKDAVKLASFARELDDIDIYFLQIELVMDEPAEFQDYLLGRIK